ncbi:MAG: hypothetical protein EA376_10820 [Phycisphaeraceae bacterium]|nr:MAG: hypothetical protein EA376_10820 [Phycisphaeraceae bacterium]
MGWFSGKVVASGSSPLGRVIVSVGCAMLLSLSVVALAGCQEESRIVGMRGILHNTPGAESGLRDDGVGDIRSERLDHGSRSGGGGDVAARPAYDEKGRPINPLRKELEDGSIRLICDSPRHLVTHLRQTLMAEERELIAEQLISLATREEYIRQGRDPDEAVEFLFQHRREVLRLLARMPMGELTPGMWMKPVGGGAYRLEVQTGASELRFRSLDVIWERGQCRLAMIR